MSNARSRRIRTFSNEYTDKMIELIRENIALFNCQLDSYRDEGLKINICKNIADSFKLSG